MPQRGPLCHQCQGTMQHHSPYCRAMTVGQRQAEVRYWQYRVDRAQAELRDAESQLQRALEHLTPLAEAASG